MAQKKTSVEQLLSVLRNIPDDRSDDEQELPFDIELDHHEFFPVPSSSDTDDVDVALEPLSTFSNTPFYYLL